MAGFAVTTEDPARESSERSVTLIAGSLSIEPFEGSRPEFGRAIAYRVFNWESDT